jgi:hypothetical protein
VSPVGVQSRRRNGVDISSSSLHQLNQNLTSATTSIYHNLLTVRSADVEDHTGSFSCTIGNSRGSSTQRLDINGLLINELVCHKLTSMFRFNEQPHQVQSSANFSCSSDLEVQTIQWLNNSDNGRELFSATRQQQLLLSIEGITSSLVNTMYTCEVRVAVARLPIRQTITIRVIGKFYMEN